MKSKCRNILLIFTLFLNPFWTFGADLYNPLTGYLTIPKVVIDGSSSGQAPIPCDKQSVASWVAYTGNKRSTRLLPDDFRISHIEYAKPG